MNNAYQEETKMNKDESMLSKELRGWEVTNLLHSDSKRAHGRARQDLIEEEKGPMNQEADQLFNFEMPSDVPPGAEARLEYLRNMERQLFPSQNSKPRKEKNRLKAYKKIRDTTSNSLSHGSHNFVGDRIRVREDESCIERHLKEIRGEANTGDMSFIPERHQNRVRGLDDQDEVNHPLLSEALAYDSDGRPSSVIRANNRAPIPQSSTQADSDEYVCQNVDPAKHLHEEILRNKQAKARLRELEKQASLNRAKKQAPLQQYYKKKNLRGKPPRMQSQH